MQKLLPLFCLAGLWTALAQEPRGTITADPNPCRIVRDRHDCTVSLSWHSEGVRAAKVFVVGEGRHPAAERIFSDSRNCEPGKCMAPWIENDTRYRFDLVDFSSGNRGRVLASITVSGEFADPGRDHDVSRAGNSSGEGGRPTGSMTADPNPCRIEPGQHECTTYISWQTQNVRKARVFVTAEGRHPGAEREFNATLACAPHTCRASWIEPETRYTFQLYDVSRGDRGQPLATVVVTAAGR